MEVMGPFIVYPKGMMASQEFICVGRHGEVHGFSSDLG